MGSADNKSEIVKKINALKEKRSKHKGDWITYEDAKEYRDRAEKLPYNGFQDIGKRRELRIECQERFGLTEGEAINILNGYNMRDIVQVYENIRDLKIPNEKDVELYLELMQQKDDGNEAKDEKENNEDDEV